jgi:hypothetical protein
MVGGFVVGQIRPWFRVLTILLAQIRRQLLACLLRGFRACRPFYSRLRLSNKRKKHREMKGWGLDL